MSWLRELGVEAGGNQVFAGLFHCTADPTWQDLAQQARERGYYAGVPSSIWNGITIVGVERRGYALAEATTKQVWLLTPNGAAHEAETFDKLAQLIRRTYDLSGLDRYDQTRPFDVDPTVLPEPPDFIAVLARGDDDEIQAAFEATLASEPLFIAYVRLAWRLARAIEVPIERRDEWLGTLRRLITRREPRLIGTWLPLEITRGCAAVAEWAAAPLPFDRAPAGPFMGDLSGERVVIEEGDRPLPDTAWLDVPATIAGWASAWKADVTVIVARCEAHPKRFVITQRIADLTNRWRYIEDKQRARGWLTRQHEYWPFALLAAPSLTKLTATANLIISLVEGVREEALLRELVLATPLSYVNVSFAEAYIRNVKAPDDFVLAMLDRAKDPAWFDVAVPVIASRVDLPAARAFAHTHFDKAASWFASAFVAYPSKESTALLRQKARARKLDLRHSAVAALVDLKEPGAEEQLEAILDAQKKSADRI